MGNTKEVIEDISGAIKKDTTDSKIKKAASNNEDAAKEEVDCPPDEVVTKAKSPIDGTDAQPKKIEVFFNVQLMAVGKNGESSFKEVSVPRINLRDQVAIYAATNSMTREQVLALGEEKLRDIMLNSSSYLTGQTKIDVAENSLLVGKLAGIKDEALIYKTLEKEMSKASYAKKVNFLANFLSYLYENYDYDAVGTSSGKNATDAEMMAAIDQSIRTGKMVPAGICRQMHQLAVRYAQAMGIKEAFGISFRTQGGGHRTLVLTSPDDPNKVIQLNYGYKSENNGVTGPSALSQNHIYPDSGIRFRVFNGKDDQAISLPSEQGGILNIVTGGKDSDLSPNYKSDAQIQQFGVGTPYGTVRFFHAETPIGNQSSVTGAAYNTKVSYNDVFYGEYGIAGFSSTRPVQEGKLKSVGAYGQMTQGFNWQFYQSKDLKLSTFGELHVRGSLFCASVGDARCGTDVDFQADLMGGLVARYNTGPVKHTTTLLLQVQGDLDSNSTKPSANVSVVKISHDMDIKVNSSITGNLGGTVTVYPLGTGQYWVFNGHTGLNSQKTGTYFGLSADGRLTNATPIWLPGAENSGSVIIKQSIFKDKVYVGVDGKKSFDVAGNHYVGLSLGGRF
ncbi:MAG TPA: hypothetical protein VNJ08_10095 [Bacteriovoracaceae bacterium]|nr:hypothetical protein [Bacteriovoracaceae bacterium]